jgi:hypothetical protein
MTRSRVGKQGTKYVDVGRMQPEGALSHSAEHELLAAITDLLLAHEGVDPSNEKARPLAWVFVQRC